MVSTCPYSIVQFEGRPSRWASRCTDSHSSPVSFLSAMVARAAGLNTSAPPPGRLVTPASFRAIRTSLTDSCSMRARCAISTAVRALRSEEHTSELQSLAYLVCRLLLEKKKKKKNKLKQSTICTDSLRRVCAPAHD